MKKISIVTTTINNPTFLVEYAENFRKFDVNLDNVNFIIVGDNKTPKLWENIEYEFSNIEYWSPEKQDKWLKQHFPHKIEKIKQLIIPENDMRRRNFGYLRAKELNSDIVITIDDDNFPLKEESWLKLHINSLRHPHRNISSKNKVINPCNFLKKNYLRIYSRGYPISEYYFNALSQTPGRNRSILNMGLWTNKPDVDSFTNIRYPDLKSEGFYDKCCYSLAKDNYFPINTQNTSFKKELSIFHNLYMDPTLFHRFDDIWIGLFTQKLMHKLGDTASFGEPLVEHRRNRHNYAKDFKTEAMGIFLNSRMWKAVMEMNIESKTYRDGFLEIAEYLPSIFSENIMLQHFFERMKKSMELWVELIEKI